MTHSYLDNCLKEAKLKNIRKIINSVFEKFLIGSFLEKLWVGRKDLATAFVVIPSLPYISAFKTFQPTFISVFNFFK